MDINPNILRRDTVRLLGEVNEELSRYKNEASMAGGSSPFHIRDVNGNAQYGMLVTAKLSALNTLALLNGK